MVIYKPSSEDVRIYETCILYPYPLNQKEEKELLNQIKECFDEAEAKELSVDNWGRHGLAYTIGGYDQGCYVIYYHEMDPLNLKELDNNLKLVQGILRHMIIKPPKDYEVVAFADKLKDWEKKKKEEAEERKKEEEERLKKRMLRKQKPRIRKDDPKSAPPKKDDADEEKISADIDKLIADDDLEL